ncbi:MAG: HNH endonuclease [Gammaproteobacteria bacterium]|nr:HNH endonuclease [Gammaproteobacteria bacterium]
MRAVTSIEELDRNILNLCTRINAATYELLVLIREFEERGGHLKWGLENCAEWLAWRCDLSMTTALEKVRVARALKTLPSISAAFSTGELSYSKVRAMTRVASAGNEDELAAFSLRHTASHVAERCRELRMGDVASISIAERAMANRSLRVRRDTERGMMTVTVDLPLEAGELVDTALDKARDDACLEVPDLVDTSWCKRQADAFVTMVKAYLAGDTAEGTADNYLVTIHVDQSALAGNDGRSALPIESVKRLCCDAKAVVLTEENGQPLSIGRKSRIVPTALQRAVRARDNDTCTFPGCRNHRFLHCHHVEHWSNGGETSLDNLVLLCTKHHTLVHEGGFRIDKDFEDNWTFYRPDGIAVPDVGYHSRDWLDTETGEVSTAYDNPPAGGLLSVAERSAREPPAPVYLH